MEFPLGALSIASSYDVEVFIFSKLGVLMFVCINHKDRVADYKMSVNDVVTVGICAECEHKLETQWDDIFVVVTRTYMHN